MKQFLSALQQAAITYTQAVEQFGEQLVLKAYDKGRISFEGELVVFIQ